MKKCCLVACIMLILLSGCAQSVDPEAGETSDSLIEELSEGNFAGGVSISNEHTPGGEDPTNVQSTNLADTLGEIGISLDLSQIESIKQVSSLDLSYVSEAEMHDYQNYEIIVIYGQDLSSYAQKKEFHIFVGGIHTGVIPFNPNIHGIEFYHFDETVWMLVHGYHSHGMGPGSFYKEKATWYEISHPDCIEVLAYTYSLSSSNPYPHTCVEYTTEVTGTQTEELNDKEFFTATISWEEAHTLRDLSDHVLFHLSGEVTVRYDPDYGFQLYGSIDRDGYITYNSDEMTYGRHDYDLMLTFCDQIIELTENGTQEEKDWVADYMEYMVDMYRLSDLDAIYQWGLANPSQSEIDKYYKH